ASSNEVRVRVEFSKKRLITVLPRRVGAFFSARRFSSAKAWAESSRETACSSDNCLMLVSPRNAIAARVIVDQTLYVQCVKQDERSRACRQSQRCRGHAWRSDWLNDSVQSVLAFNHVNTLVCGDRFDPQHTI